MRWILRVKSLSGVKQRVSVFYISQFSFQLAWNEVTVGFLLLPKCFPPPPIKKLWINFMPYKCCLPSWVWNICLLAPTGCLSFPCSLSFFLWLFFFPWDFIKRLVAVQARCGNGRLLIMCLQERAGVAYSFPAFIDEGHSHSLLLIQTAVYSGLQSFPWILRFHSVSIMLIRAVEENISLGPKKSLSL